MPFTTNEKFAAVAAGTVLLIVILVIILVIKKDTTEPSPSTTKRINNVTYTDVNDGPHRIIGNDFYYNYYKGSFDKPFATGTWISPNAYAVFIVGWRGWIVMKIASDFTMKTAFKAGESTYVPTVADIDTLTTDRTQLVWTGNLAGT